MSGPMKKRARIDSKIYRADFYGILNASGDFWTPIAFESEVGAWEHVRRFWGRQTDMYARCRRDFKIVPVRIRLEALPASAIDATGTGAAEGESAVPSQTADAHNTPEAPHE